MDSDTVLTLENTDEAIKRAQNMVKSMWPFQVPLMRATMAKK
jgi:hypothetical protein